jgi:hypothetical protein
MAPTSTNQFPCHSVLEHELRVHALALLTRFLFQDVVVPLLSCAFYITESEIHRNRLLFFRIPVWRAVFEQYQSRGAIVADEETTPLAGAQSVAPPLILPEPSKRKHPDAEHVPVTSSVPAPTAAAGSARFALYRTLSPHDAVHLLQRGAPHEASGGVGAVTLGFGMLRLLPRPNGFRPILNLASPSAVAPPRLSAAAASMFSSSSSSSTAASATTASPSSRADWLHFPAVNVAVKGIWHVLQHYHVGNPDLVRTKFRERSRGFLLLFHLEPEFPRTCCTLIELFLFGLMRVCVCLLVSARRHVFPHDGFVSTTVSFHVGLQASVAVGRCSTRSVCSSHGHSKLFRSDGSGQTVAHCAAFVHTG